MFKSKLFMLMRSTVTYMPLRCPDTESLYRVHELLHSRESAERLAVTLCTKGLTVENSMFYTNIVCVCVCVCVCVYIYIVCVGGGR